MLSFLHKCSLFIDDKSYHVGFFTLLENTEKKSFNPAPNFQICTYCVCFKDGKADSRCNPL